MGRKRERSRETFGGKSGSPCRGGPIGAGGGWGKSGSVASKIRLFFSPAMPERLRRILQMGSDRELSVTMNGEGKKWFMGVLSYLWGNSKDDANHL